MTNQIQNVSIDELHFDRENPRLPSKLHNRLDEQVINWMLRDASLIELMLSIGEKDFFPGEPLLAIKHETKAGSFIIVEGNRRLAATKLLNNANLATIRKTAVRTAVETALHKPKKLPILVYDQKDDVLSYLGYRHITGVNRWGPLAKAKYLHQLQQRYLNLPANDLFVKLAKEIGSRPDYVAKLLTGLSIYEHIESENFFGIPGLNEETISFSLITTALGYSNLYTFLGLSSNQSVDLAGLDLDRLKEFCHWLFAKNERGNTLLGESRNLATLARIVAHSDALAQFRENVSLEKADLLTSGPTEAFNNLLADALTDLETARDVAQDVQPNDFHQKQIEKILNTTAAVKSIIRGLPKATDIETA